MLKLFVIAMLCLSMAFGESVLPRQTTRRIEAIRLVNSTSTGAREGRVEILSEGVWGTVCDDFFEDNAVKVACRSLGLPVPVFPASPSVSVPADDTTPILIDDVKCIGTELSLNDCPHTPFGTHNCAHSEDVSISCNERGPLTVRLTNGNSTYGLAEVSVGGEWGTICDNAFNDLSATVFCRMLGRNSGVFDQTRISAGSGRIWMANVFCSGQETSLSDCEIQTSRHNCGHIEDVWIRCD